MTSMNISGESVLDSCVCFDILNCFLTGSLVVMRN